MLSPGDRVRVVKDKLAPSGHEWAPFKDAEGTVVLVEKTGVLRVKVALDTIKSEGRGATYWFDEDELRRIK